MTVYLSLAMANAGPSSTMPGRPVLVASLVVYNHFVSEYSSFLFYKPKKQSKIMDVKIDEF